MSSRVTSTSRPGTDDRILVSPDPTGTKTVRDTAVSAANARWRDLRGDIRRALTERGGGLRREFGDSVVGTAQFRTWLNNRLGERIRAERVPYAIENGQHWTSPFITEAYKRGMRRGDTFLQIQDIDTPRRDPTAALTDDAYQAELAELRTRLYVDILGASDAALTDATRAYTNVIGGAAGDSAGAPTETTGGDTRASYASLAGTITGRVDAVGQTRTQTSIETRIIEAANLGAFRRYDESDAETIGFITETDASLSDIQENTDALAHADDADANDDADGGSDADAGILWTLPAATAARGSDDEKEETEVLWVTAGDDRVCEDCALMEGAAFPKSQVKEGGAPSPPLHPKCRCIYYAY